MGAVSMLSLRRRPKVAWRQGSDSRVRIIQAMSEIESDSEASLQDLRSERPVRTTTLAISAKMTRRELRVVCMRIHDVDGVVTIEVDRAEASIRVTGTMDLAELGAVIGAAEPEGT